MAGRARPTHPAARQNHLARVYRLLTLCRSQGDADKIPTRIDIHRFDAVLYGDAGRVPHP
jgi:hypothetical protein